MLWRRQQRWEAFASASATLSLTSLVGGLKTMSPAPGRRPPISGPFCVTLYHTYSSLQARPTRPPYLWRLWV